MGCVVSKPEDAKQLDADNDNNNHHIELESTKAPEGLPPIVTVPAATDAPPAPATLAAPPRSARLPPRTVCLPPSPFSYQAAQPAAFLQAGPKPEPPVAPLPASEAAVARTQPPGSEAAPAAVAPAEPPCVEVAAAAAEPPDAGAEVAAPVTADITGADSQAAAAAPSGADISAAAAAAAATMAFSVQADGACGGAEHYGIPPADEIIMHSEEERLRALRMLGVVQQPMGREFGSITSLLKLIFDVPLAQAYLMEEHEAYSVPNSEDEQWAAFPRCTSHCRYMFEPTNHEMVIVEDLTQDMRYKTSVWVTGPPGVRFYASAPLVSTISGHRYGTICVVDLRPRHFSAQQYQMLAHLAEVAVRELESARMMHWQQLQMEDTERSMHRFVRSLDCFSEGILLCDVEGGWGVRYANSAFTRLTGLERQQAVGTSLWSFFGLPAGGPKPEDVQAALQGSNPVTISIGLLPGSAPSASADARPSTSSSSLLEAGGLFTATFTPASSPEFRPDAPAISIPIAPSPPGMTGNGCGSDSSSSTETRLWFVTIQRPGVAKPSVPSTHASASSTQGSLASGVMTTSLISHLQPSNMKEVQLGPLLGAGASGRAYRGMWFGTEVCVKVLDLYAPLSPAGGSSSMCSAEPLLEAALSKALLHPNIVPTHAWGISEGVINAQGQHHSQVWIVQSLCTLGTLAHARDRGLFQDPTTQGPDLRPILLTMRDVAAALSYLHSVGVVHGDLSGNNVLLSPSSADERGFTAMVADFGLARPQGLSPDAVPRGCFGTVPNMPPELLAGDVLSPAADSWAFGTLLWELLSGRRAWRGMGPMQIITAVTFERRSLSVSQQWPSGIKDLISACLRHDPSERPTAQKIFEMVEDLLGG